MKMKQYRAIFFDWDGTAVTSRRAPVDSVLQLMRPLLERGTILCIISGTSYDKIANGRLHELLPENCLQNLYLGLDRGARNYGFDNGKAVIIGNRMPTTEQKLLIDEAAFAVHTLLYRSYGYPTDIVFSRANYCKLDLQVELDRGEQLFFQVDELSKVEALLEKHGFVGGLTALLAVAEQVGSTDSLPFKATTDAKYLELGITTKSDNVDFFMEKFFVERGVTATDCCFWGDEFTYLAPGISGSDAFMHTTMTAQGDFFDVSPTPPLLPEWVEGLGGSTERFGQFLAKLAE